MAILAMSLTNGTLAVVVQEPTSASRIVSIRSDDARWSSIMDAYKNGDEASIERMLSLKSVVEAFSFGDISVTAAGVTYKNVPLHTLDVQRIMAFLREGIPYERYAKFVARKMKNPSSRTVNEMYRFLENEFMPLTPEGTFIAYKGVQNDYFSKMGNKDTIVIQGVVNERGQILNRIGDTIEIERSSCDDNYLNCCSFGLHAGSIQYATGYGDRAILVEIDPADVVSVPNEGGFHKLRCCKYKVIADYTGPLPQHYTNEFSSIPDEECVGEECPDCHGHDCCCEDDNACDGHDDCGCDNCCGNDSNELDDSGDGTCTVCDHFNCICDKVESSGPNNSYQSVLSDIRHTNKDAESSTPWTTGYNDGFKEEKYPKYLPGDENGADSENHRLYIAGYLAGYAFNHLPNKEG